MKKRSLLLIAIILLTFIIIGYSIIKKTPYYKISPRVDSYTSMKQKYKEITGWVRVQGTDIDYPIIQSSKVVNVDTVGYDFVWTNSTSNKLENRAVIYGHNILNVSNKPLIRAKGQTKFEQLLGFVYLNVVKDNKYIQYTINNKDYLYKIYSVAFISETKDKGQNITNKQELKNYINNSKDISLFKFDVDVNENDKLISLITCTRYFGYDKSYIHFRVDGRLVRKNEQLTNYKVEESKYYNKILGGDYFE